LVGAHRRGRPVSRGRGPPSRRHPAEPSGHGGTQSMKCPKCNYLGFETGDRCKNCGYDFSLMAAASEPEEVEVDLMMELAATANDPLPEIHLVPPPGPESVAASQPD